MLIGTKAAHNLKRNARRKSVVPVISNDNSQLDVVSDLRRSYRSLVESDRARFDVAEGSNFGSTARPANGVTRDATAQTERVRAATQRRLSTRSTSHA